METTAQKEENIQYLNVEMSHQRAISRYWGKPAHHVEGVRDYWKNEAKKREEDAKREYDRLLKIMIKHKDFLDDSKF